MWPGSSMLVEPGVTVFPFYLVIETSYGTPSDTIAGLNELVPQLLELCIQRSWLADMIRFSLITFDESATSVIPMTSYDAAALPTLAAEAAPTRYTAAFRELRDRIDPDVDALKSQGHRVFRPHVFLIVSHDPNGETAIERQQAWASLTDPDWRRHPNASAIGIGQVADESLTSFASHRGRAFNRTPGASRASATAAACELITSSIASLGNASPTANAPLAIYPSHSQMHCANSSSQ